MNRSSSLAWRLALSGQFACLLVAAPDALAQDSGKSQRTPSALARQSFEHPPPPLLEAVG